MKKILKYITFALLSLGFFASCKELVDDLDKDLNNPDDAPAELMLVGTQIADALIHEGELARLAGMWSGYFTGSDRQYIGLWQYNSTARDFDSPWGNLYGGVVGQAKVIRKKTEVSGNRALEGVAKILEAHAVGTAAALWGDVPFTQAGNDEQFPNPAFDEQTVVYQGLQALLDEAIEDLASNIGNIPSDDIFFGGNKANWIAVAYTLKARYYMHVKNYSAAYSAAQNGITDPDGSMLTPHGGTFGQNFNIYYSFLVYDRSGYMTAIDAYAPKLLDPRIASSRNNAKTDEQARLDYLFLSDPNDPTFYEPNYFYSADFGTPPNSDGYFGATTSFRLITYEENTLILAEAGARTQSLAVGLGHLNEFRAYMNSGGYITSQDYGTVTMLPYTAADFAPGGIENNSGTALTADEALLKEILEERYITLIGNLEGFIDIRRTFKETKVRVNIPINFGDKIPQRFIYPQSEINANTNAPAPVDIFEPTDVNK